jgi:hypothetical protein
MFHYSNSIFTPARFQGIEAGFVCINADVAFATAGVLAGPVLTRINDVLASQLISC